MTKLPRGVVQPWLLLRLQCESGVVALANRGGNVDQLNRKRRVTQLVQLLLLQACGFARPFFLGSSRNVRFSRMPPIPRSNSQADGGRDGERERERERERREQKRRGEERRGEERSRGERSRGEKSRGEKSRGEKSRGEKSRGEKREKREKRGEERRREEE